MSKNQLIYFFCSFLYHAIRNVSHFWHHPASPHQRDKFLLISPLQNAGHLEDLSPWVPCTLSDQLSFWAVSKGPANLHTRISVKMWDCHSYSAWFVQRGFLSDAKSVIRLCLAPWIKDVMFLILPLMEVLEWPWNVPQINSRDMGCLEINKIE